MEQQTAATAPVTTATAVHAPIGVGIVGANARQGWAALAHVPALKGLADFTLAAVSSRHAESAQAAALAFDVPRAYGSTEALVQSPEVDLVVVTVPVPAHRPVIAAAVAAGKNVYCEWPLGNGLAEAEELAALVKAGGVHGAIGLQARAVPAIRYVRDLLQEGYVGEVLSTTLVGSGLIFGAFTPQAFAWAADRNNGAGMLHSSFGHAIDALCYCLGEFDHLVATVANRRPTTTVLETGESIPLTAFDQVAVSGVLTSGAVATAHFRAGMSAGTNFHWEINGTAGDLVLTGGGGHPAVFPLTLQGSRGEGASLDLLAVPDKYTLVPAGIPAGPAFNVAQHYALLAQDLRTGTHLSPTFDEALLRHRLLHAIETAAATGTRQRYL